MRARVSIDKLELSIEQTGAEPRLEQAAADALAHGLSDAEWDTLRELRAWTAARTSGATPRRDWVTPILLGGRDWSHHSKSLRVLVRRGLAYTRQRGSLKFPDGLTGPDAWQRTTPTSGRGSRHYRITRAGRQACEIFDKATPSVSDTPATPATPTTRSNEQ